MSHFTPIHTQIKDPDARGYYQSTTYGDYVIQLKDPHDIAQTASQTAPSASPPIFTLGTSKTKSAPTGEVRIDAVNFKGADCEAVTWFLEEALGTAWARQRKPEYHQRQPPAAAEVGRMKFTWGLVENQQGSLHLVAATAEL